MAAVVVDLAADWFHHQQQQALDQLLIGKLNRGPCECVQIKKTKMRLRVWKQKNTKGNTKNFFFYNYYPRMPFRPNNDHLWPDPNNDHLWPEPNNVRVWLYPALTPTDLEPALDEVEGCDRGVGYAAGQDAAQGAQSEVLGRPELTAVTLGYSSCGQLAPGSGLRGLNITAASEQDVSSVLYHRNTVHLK